MEVLICFHFSLIILDQIIQSIAKLFFLIGFILCLIIGIFCIIGFTDEMGFGGFIISLIVTAFIFIMFWLSTLFIVAFGKMSEDLEYQSERLAEIQDKLNSVTSAAKE